MSQGQWHLDTGEATHIHRWVGICHQPRLWPAGDAGGLQPWVCRLATSLDSLWAGLRPMAFWGPS